MFGPLSTIDEPKATSVFSATDNNNLKANIKYNSYVCVCGNCRDVKESLLPSNRSEMHICWLCNLIYVRYYSFRANHAPRFIQTPSSYKRHYLHTKIELY